jgi:ABC-type bacteriocin/lantibiotic exporter with double-glycine peptidase domain
MRLVTVGRSIYGVLLPDERRKFRLLFLMSLASALLEAVGAVLVLSLLTRFTSGEHPTAVDRLFPGYAPDDVTLILGLLTLVYAMLRMTFSLAESHLQLRRVQQFAGSLSARVLEHYGKSPLLVHQTQRSGDFLRNTWYASEMLIRQSLQGILAVGTETAVIIGLVTVLAVISPATALGVVAGGAALVYSGYRVFGRYITGWGASAEDHASECLQQIQEFFGGFREIKLANAEGFFVSRYRKDRDLLAQAYWRYQTMSQAPRLVTEGLLAAAVAGLVMTYTLRGSEQAGLTTMALFGYAGFRVLPSANRLLAAIGNVSYGIPALDLVNPVLHGPTENLGVSREPFKVRDLIGIRDVSVTYPGAIQPAVTGISFQVKRGESIGLIGASGEGKTTILNVVAGLISPDSGEVLVDGRDIRDSLVAWRAQVGLVAQTAFMADSTIRTNVAFGSSPESIDDERVWWALERAKISDQVLALPDGLSTYMGDRGVRMSGGQSQRISIARALYKGAEVLILDEPTASLDRATEIDLAESLTEIAESYTTIVVSHRLPILRNCTRIHLVEKGRLVQDGTYEDFAQIAESLRGALDSC